MPLFIISFIAGVLTILTPCVLPLLPVIVGSSMSGETSRKKAIIVTASLGISVIAFTFILKVSTLFVNIPEQAWQYISGGIIIVLGLITLFPIIWEKVNFISKANRESNKLLALGYKKDSVWGNIIIGASLGPVFSTCSPTYFFILAAVLPLNPLAGFLDLISYAFSLCLALLVVAIVGQKAVEKLGLASDPKGWLKKTLGILFLVVGIGIFIGADKKLEYKILDSGVFDFTKIEQFFLKKADVGNNENPASNQAGGNITNLADDNSLKLNENASSTAKESEAERIARKSKLYKRAPEIENPSGFINTDGKSITIGQFKGKKVVLIDFWTYSCINCQRTLPYLREWYEKYHDQGLEIIGIHTPEFSFEKLEKNVAKAVQEFNLKYPVVLDNDYSIWNVFANRYWPRKYLIDSDGFIVYDHIGEGDYDVTEKAIQKALEDRANILVMPDEMPSSISLPKDTISLDVSKVKSPETYFGYGRNEYLGNGNRFTQGEQTLSFPIFLIKNTLYLSGTWNFEKEYAETRKTDSAISFKYDAKNVYMVASAEENTLVEIWLDGKKIGSVNIKDEKLYKIIEGDSYGEHTLLLKIPKTGLKAFTFTFG